MFYQNKKEKNEKKNHHGMFRIKNIKCGRNALYKIRTMLVVILFALSFHMITASAHRQLLQQGIAEEVLRFHVLANSDSEADQKVKYQVRDAVLAWVNAQMRENTLTRSTEIQSLGLEKADLEKATALNGTEDADEPEKEEMEQFLSTHLNEIRRIADQVLASNGFSYTSTVQIEHCYFPDRTYGDCTFSAGWYEALRICLGEAKGQNWWCVLYPKLCFSDCLHAMVEEDSVTEESKEENQKTEYIEVEEEQLKKLENVLTMEEYESLLEQPKKWKIAFRWF